MKYYIVSGGFDPIHEGHIAMIKQSAAESDGVIILLNSDQWLRNKKGKEFMTFNTRYAIVENMKGVIDVVFGFDDSDGSVSDGIKMVREKYPNDELVMAKGGDRNKLNIPEVPACEKYNVTIKSGVGGTDKPNSSSWILKNWESK